MNVIDYLTITCNLRIGRLQITSDYMEKCNRLQLITITNYDYHMSDASARPESYDHNRIHTETYNTPVPDLRAMITIESILRRTIVQCQI